MGTPLANFAWADLLRLQHGLGLSPKSLEDAASWLRLAAPVPVADEAPSPPLEAAEVPAPREDPQPPTEAKTQAVDDATAPPVYWRVESITRKPPQTEEPPLWASRTEAGGDMAWLTQTLVPQAPPAPSLLHQARLHRQLAQHLQVCSGQRRLHLPQVLPRLARLQTLRRSDWQAKAQWPQRVGLVLSHPPALAPALADVHHSLALFKRLFGQRLQVWASRSGPQGLRPLGQPQAPGLQPQHRPSRPPRDGRPWILLGEADVAWLAEGGGQATPSAEEPPGPWAQWAHALARHGAQPLLVSPWPLRDIALPCRRTLQPIPLQQAAPSTLVDGVALLRAAIYGHPGVSPRTLRLLRLAMQQAGAPLDAGHELGLWRDARIHAPGTTLCIVAPEHREAVALAFGGLKPGLRQAAVRSLCNSLKASQRLVRAEYVAALRAVLPEDAPEHLLLDPLEAEPEAVHQAMARCMHQAGHHTDLRHFLAVTEQRAPDVLAPEDEARQALWLALHADDIRSGSVAVPDWADAQALQQWAGLTLPERHLAFSVTGLPWAVRATPAKGQAATLIASVQGSWEQSLEAPSLDLGILARVLAQKDHPATKDLWAYSQSKGLATIGGQQPDEALKKVAAELQAMLKAPPSLEHLAMELNAWCSALGYTTFHRLSVLFPLEGLAEEQAQRGPVQQWPPQQLLRAEAVLELETSALQARLQPFKRPPWAEALESEQGFWFATTDSGQKLEWVPGERWTTAEEHSVAVPRTWHTSGAWWDWRCFDAFMGGIDGVFNEGAQAPLTEPISIQINRHMQWLLRPHWATAHGIDQHGWWATWQIPHAPPQRMRFIPPGEFWMGSPLAEEGRWGDETLHPVTLTQGFWMAETTVSNALWGAVMGQAVKGEALHPKVEISWDDIQKQFLPALRRQTGQTNHSDWHLPSEAQWEYAARAGTPTAYPWGDAPDEQRMNIGDRVMPVDKGCPPNPWGLLHMHGNVWEWCQDATGSLGAAHALDPLNNDRRASLRVLRGGSWVLDARRCRSAMRFGGGPGDRDGDFGFRLARGLEPASAQAEPGLKQAHQGPKGRPEAGPSADPGRGGGVEQARGLLDRILGKPGSNKKT